MKIIIAGLGKVGRILTEQLVSDKHDVVVIDQNPDLVNDIVNIYDVLGVTGNCGCYSVQKEAFAGGADLLIATTSSDEINILACLVAKKIGTAHTIARIRNPEYEEQLRLMRSELGLSMVINPEEASARKIAQVLRFPSAVKLEQFSKARFELIEYRIEKDNPLTGMKLSDLYQSFKVKVLIAAVVRNQKVLIPSGSQTLMQGDVIYVTAPPEALERFFRKLNLYKSTARNVMIVGASRMAYYLCKELRNLNARITVIDRDVKKCRELSIHHPEALVIQGDGADNELLLEEGLEGMDAFVALTGMDETNIILAMYASSVNAGKVVAKINRKSFSDLAEARGMVDSVVSTGSVTTEQILQYVRAMHNSMGSNIRTLHRIVDGKAEALEFYVDEGFPFAGIPLRNLKLKPNLLVVGIVRKNGQTLIPSGNDEIQVGDDVIVVTTNSSLSDLRDICDKGRPL